MTDHKYCVFRFEDVEVREREFLLLKAGEALPVEPKAFRVLLYLLRNPNRLVTKDEILDAVWSETAVSDNSLTRSIATLRKLLGDDSREPRYIATVPTVGYRFLCAVDVTGETRGERGPMNVSKNVQAEIAGQAMKRSPLQVEDQEREQLAARPPSQDAYHLYLKAMHWANRWSEEGMRKGVDFVRQAIDADPAYAEAWATLAYIYVMIGFMGGGPPIETFARAKAAALKALKIDDGNADAHATLAYVRLLYDWDWPSAHEELLRGLELSPERPTGHFIYSHWYLTQRLFAEALAEAKIALDIEPLSVLFSCQVGVVHFFCRNYEEAIEQLQKANELDPLFGFAHQFLALAYAQKGMRTEALAELEQGLKLTKDEIGGRALWGIVDALTGKPVEAREVLNSLKQELTPPNFSSAYHCAALHSLFGERDEAFACLEMARRGRSTRMAYLAVAPNFQKLHSDPRFGDLLLRIGIPVARAGL